MKKSSWLIIVLILGLSAGLLAVKSANRAPLSDADQIHMLLAKGQAAIEQKDLKDATACVSRSYRDPSGTKFEQLRVQMIQAFQQEGKYDVLIEGTSIRVTGDTALVKASVSIRLASKSSMHRLFSSPITIDLAKEKSKHWLVFPSQEWKITSIAGAPTGFEE